MASRGGNLQRGVLATMNPSVRNLFDLKRLTAYRRPSPLILVNGLAEQSESWFANRRQLARHFDVKVPEILVYDGDSLHRHIDSGGEVTVDYLADRLARLGVEEALAEAGAEPGAEVLIGDPDDAVVFDWDPAAPMASGASGSGRRGSGHAKGNQHHGPRGTDPRLTP